MVFMTESKTIKNPSPLVLAVLSLDEHFTNLMRLSARIDEVDLKSNFDFEQVEKLITLFSETGEGISADIASFVQVLNEARAAAESSAERVTEKAMQLKLRKDETQDKMVQFNQLSDKVSKLNESLLQFRRVDGQELSEQDKLDLKNRLNEVAGQLKGFIAEAEVLKNLGQESKLKILEQNADAMRQSLIAVSKKIESLNTVQ